MLDIFKSISRSFRMTQKYVKYTTFFPKNWTSFFISALLFFFSLNNTKKKSYFNVSEMLNFNPKTSNQKYPIFCSWYNVFIANVSDFYTHFIIICYKLRFGNSKSLWMHAILGTGYFIKRSQPKRNFTFTYHQIIQTNVLCALLITKLKILSTFYSLVL